MSVETHDRVLRLTMDDFEALVSGEASREDRDDALGIEGMSQALDAARAPRLLLHVDVAVPDGGRTHLGWLGHDALALLLPVKGGRWQLMALPPDQLPVSLARIIGLGPGEGPERAAYTHAVNPFDELFSGHQETRREAFAAHGWDVAWTLGVRSDSEEWLMAGAAGPGGTWLVEPDPVEDSFHVVPVSASIVYRRLTSVLPGLLVD